MSTPTLREAAEKALVLADEYARAAAKTCVETLYGTSKSYTAECVKDEAACREALRAALAAPAAAPDGWRLVPVEPTEAMIEAARDVKRRRLLRAVEDAKAGRDPNPMGAAMACDEEWRAMHAAAPTAPAEPRVEPAPHPSTPIAALLQQYADECSDFSGPDGYAFALKIANRYAESGPDCQMRCVVHTLLNPPEPATQGEPLTDERIKAIYARETGFNLDSSPAAKTTMTVEISADPEMLRRAMAAETEAALLRAALDQKHAEYEDLQRHGNNAAHNLARMQAALAENASRSADYLRKAIKAEAEVALLRAALNGGNAIERLQFALQRLADATEALGVNNFGEDWRSDEVQELQAATHAARLVLGPNARGKPRRQASA